MDLTRSYLNHLPAETLRRYAFAETRNATAVAAATNPIELSELAGVLNWFTLAPGDITDAGGNRSDLARRVDLRFRELGWREGRHDVLIKSVLKLMPYAPAGESAPVVKDSEILSEGYKVDNVKNRIALDVEWNAKDGNLDRDLGAYRALYEYGIIDVGVIVTRTQADLRALAISLNAASSKFDTTTTTNLDKLLPRLQRGAAGGCPILAVAITARCMSA